MFDSSPAEGSLFSPAQPHWPGNAGAGLTKSELAYPWFLMLGVGRSSITASNYLTLTLDCEAKQIAESGVLVPVIEMVEQAASLCTNDVIYFRARIV